MNIIRTKVTGVDSYITLFVHNADTIMRIHTKEDKRRLKKMGGLQKWPEYDTSKSKVMELEDRKRRLKAEYTVLHGDGDGNREGKKFTETIKEKDLGFTVTSNLSPLSLVILIITNKG
ncbi:hypothetical protein OTU49_007674 [Cherax quadricarinatus]|uniref:Uncharacterized protein n=1 Tax=Cherax quadricarinatus TaxID=27406 RepID=A0AAW0WTZ8_CHEQU